MSNKSIDTVIIILGIHPTTIAESFQRAAQKSVEFLTEMATAIDLSDRESLLRAASTSLNSKVCISQGVKWNWSMNVQFG